MTSETIQLILSSVIVAAAVYLAGRSIYRAIRCKKSVLTTCADCPLANNCNKPMNRKAKRNEEKTAVDNEKTT